MQTPAISHNRQEETPEAKARWFQSLTLTQRMDLLCMYTEFMLAANPSLMEKRDAEPIEGRIRVLSAL
jgi:hypothetical protein